MPNHPNRPAGRDTPTRVNLVAKISQKENNTTQDAVPQQAPDTLTLLKRRIDFFDLLEVSNNASWVTRTGTITNPKYRQLFAGQRLGMTRLRYRHLFYGLEKFVLNDCLTVLLAT